MSKLEELKATAAKLQQQIEALEKPKQWEPRGGYHSVTGHGRISSVVSTNLSRVFGVERQSWKAAEKARATMRTHNRLLAYVDEFGGDWVADWNFKAQNKCFIVYDGFNHGWVLADTYRAHSLGAVYMSQECAEGLIAKLESGEVLL